MNIKVKLTRQENLDYYQADIINIDLEEYLRGVVPSEIGNAPFSACAAQAIAARTYALYNQNNLSDDSSKCQAFRASRLNGAYPNAYAAVDETAGQVLYYNNKLICAYYSSSNGGRIKSSEERWGGKRDYLISKNDPYDNGSGKGHGVGMSQLGAKTMANLGFSYKDILDFYFPGTEIRKQYGKEVALMTNPEKVVAWAKSKIGCGYVWGATGQTATQSALEQLKAKYPSHVDLNIVKKWLGKQIFDCASFVAKAMSQVGIAMKSGATSAWTATQWEQKGTIDTLPVNKVCCLYRQVSVNPVKMQHTGLYLGDGTFIDARGSVSGVIGPNKINSYKWTHWGIPVGLYSNTQEPEVIKVAYEAIVTADSGKTVNMRASESTGSAVLFKIPIGTIVDVESTTDDWAKILYKGKQGYMMNKYLSKVGNSESNKYYYVRVKCESEEQAKALVEIFKTAETAS